MEKVFGKFKKFRGGVLEGVHADVVVRKWTVSVFGVLKLQRVAVDIEVLGGKKEALLTVFSR